MRKKTSLSLRFSIPEREEEVWLVSLLFWHTDCYFISDRKCEVYWRMWLEGHVAQLPPPQKKKKKKSPPPPKKKKKKKKINHNLEVKAFILPFGWVIWEKCHWKTLLDQHLNWAIQISLCDANLRTHGPKTIIRMTVTRLIILIGHFCSHVKHSRAPPPSPP